ncbi:MAG TPA: CoA-binding protein [Nitrososphaerales archaeon]|nr:CoA-binding protein [Nitrososphaerales archaeon]
MVKGTASPAEVLAKAKMIAVVGASANPEKEAHRVPLYLKQNGYRIIPVNPTAREVFGEKAYPSLLDLPEELGRTIDVVEVFRPSEELPKVALQVVELRRRYGTSPVFWSQAGLENDEAKSILDAAGIPYVMDSCMRTIHRTQVRRAV